VQAAQLAADGITGPEAAFEGRYGFDAMYEDGDPAIVLQGLGRRFEHGEVIFKKFPTCACGHAASQAALELIARTPVQPEQIAGIVITITPYMNGGRARRQIRRCHLPRGLPAVRRAGPPVAGAGRWRGRAGRYGGVLRRDRVGRHAL
jgi:hypothetical protein